jgi:hypothetical protein
MSFESEESLSAVPDNIWTRLMLSVAQKRKEILAKNFNEALKASAMEKQEENLRKGGTIWEAVCKADEATFKNLIKENPSNVDVRGPIGECPIHMLFLYGTETHLNMARYLITNFPHTLTQTYNQPVN